MVLQWRSLLEFCSGGGGGEEQTLSAKCDPRCRAGAPHQWVGPHIASCGLLPWCGVESGGTWPAPADLLMPGWEERLQPITSQELEESMKQLSLGVKPWEPRSFIFVRHLQEALGNHGSVEMMQSTLKDGRFVAVKCIPNRWMCVGHQEFRQRYPLSPELPWTDLGILRQLSERSFPYTCELLGLYGDENSTYVVTSLARCGDLLSWCARPPAPSLEREELAKPIAGQIFVAARWLHELGIAHRDLSPENVLLSDDGSEMRVRIVDFGMATSSRFCRCEVRGKEAFQAPEMHWQEPYDAFLADVFQLGVILYLMVARERPWQSTRPGACRRFGWFADEGHLPTSANAPLAGSSLALVSLLEGLLEAEPGRRLTLGEACFAEEERESVWDAAWLGEVSKVVQRRWPCDRSVASEASAQPVRAPI